MKSYILVILILSSSSLYGQDSTRISWNASIMRQSYAMNSVNTLIADTSTYFPQRLGSIQIEQGNHIQFGMTYHITERIHVGAYGSYQFGKAADTPDRMRIEPFSGDTTFYTAESQIRADAIGFGGIVQYHLPLSVLPIPLSLAVELKGGVGISTIQDEVFDPLLNVESRVLYHSSRDFQSSLGLNLGYRVLNKAHVLYFGLKGGYQWYSTDAMTSGDGTNIDGLPDKTVSLDFSGWYGGLYIILSR